MAKPTAKELLERLAALEAENAALKAVKAQGNRISFKVSEKGAISAYGLGRFPVTLYPGQWERLAGVMPELAKFAEEHKSDPRILAANAAHAKG